MELKSFREILLKKAEDNPYLQTLIKYAKDELLADEVLEALLKMAEPSAAMGRGANHAVTSYGAGVKPVHVEQMRDALSHHISHYKGALEAHHKSENPTEKANLRNVADQHLNKIVPLMHLAGKASKHSGGNLTLDYPSTTPWETNYTSTERLPNGKLKEGTKDLGRRPAPRANRTDNPRAVPDYRYLESPPHPGHASTDRLATKGGYPFEDIQLGSPAKRNAGQAYLPIEDVGQKNEFTPHPFDSHPVHQHADKSQSDIGPDDHEAINSALAGWTDSDQHKQWMADQKAKHTKDPEAYKARGTKKPEHVYGNVPLNMMPHHNEALANQAKTPATVAPDTASPQQVAEAQAAAAPVQEQKAAPATKAAKAKQSFDMSKPPEGLDVNIAKHWKSFPENTRMEILRDFAKRNK
jgi:hypothetical protein